MSKGKKKEDAPRKAMTAKDIIAALEAEKSPENLADAMESVMYQIVKEFRENPKNKWVSIYLLDERLHQKAAIMAELRKNGFGAKNPLNPFAFKNTFLVSLNGMQVEEKKAGPLTFSAFGRQISIDTKIRPLNNKKWFLITSGVASLALLGGAYITFAISTGASVYFFKKMGQ